MRTVYKILAMLSILATMCIAIIAVSIYGQKEQNFATLNWDFLLPALFISGVVVIFGGAGVFTLATNRQVWKKLEELQAEEDDLRRERLKIMELKEKLVSKVID